VFWYAAFVLYAGVCAGWGLKQGWEEDGLSDALGSAFGHLVMSPFVPFILLGYLWDRRKRRRAERDHLYSPFGGYEEYVGNARTPASLLPSRPTVERLRPNPSRQMAPIS